MKLCIAALIHHRFPALLRFCTQNAFYYVYVNRTGLDKYPCVHAKLARPLVRPESFFFTAIVAERSLKKKITDLFYGLLSSCK